MPNSLEQSRGDEQGEAPREQSPLSKLLKCGVPQSFAARFVALLESSRSYEEFTLRLDGGCGAGLSSAPVLIFIASYLYPSEFIGADFKDVHATNFAKFAPLKDAFFGGPLLVDELRARLRHQIESYPEEVSSRESLSELLVTLGDATSVNPSLIPWDDNGLATFVLNQFFIHLIESEALPEKESISAFFTALQVGLDIHVKIIPNSKTLLPDWVYSLDEVPDDNLYGLQRGDCIRVLSIVGIIDVYRSFLVEVFNGDGSSKPSQSPLVNVDGTIKIVDGFIDLCRISAKLSLARNTTIAPPDKNG